MGNSWEVVGEMKTFKSTYDHKNLFYLLTQNLKFNSPKHCMLLGDSGGRLLSGQWNVPGTNNVLSYLVYSCPFLASFFYIIDGAQTCMRLRS